MTAGIVNAQKAISAYYVLGYYTTNTAPDGKFRRISISLKEIPAKLDYRSGYFANKIFARFSPADKERQLEDALMLEDPVTELTVEVNYFQLNDAEYYVPVVMKIPGLSSCPEPPPRSLRRCRFTTKPASPCCRVPTPSRVLARDESTGRIGTYLSKFVIPNLNKEDKRVPISSVVLSSQRADLRDSLYTAGKDREHTAHPLVQQGQKPILSVTRVFKRDRELYVYLHAYRRNLQSGKPAVAYVTFFRGQSKAFETLPLPFTDGLGGRLDTVPLQFNISLAKFAPGRYNCQVTVLDSASQKANYWQAPILVAP